MKRRMTIFFGVILLIILVGCGQSVNVEEPPEIVYGQDVCERCGMLISEEGFAAAYWTEEGEAHRFDDIGGMLAYVTDETEQVASYWVHDFATGEWIRAEEAHYLLDSELMTPMGFGIAAFISEEEARALAYGEENVKTLAFADLLEMNIKMPEDLHILTHKESMNSDHNMDNVDSDDMDSTDSEHSH